MYWEYIVCSQNMGGLKWKPCYKNSRALASARVPPLICRQITYMPLHCVFVSSVNCDFKWYHIFKAAAADTFTFNIERIFCLSKFEINISANVWLPFDLFDLSGHVFFLDAGRLSVIVAKSSPFYVSQNSLVSMSHAWGAPWLGTSRALWQKWGRVRWPSEADSGQHGGRKGAMTCGSSRSNLSLLFPGPFGSGLQLRMA